MSTKTLGWLVGARDGKKLGSSRDPVNSIPTLSQPRPFQTFAAEWNTDTKQKKEKNKNPFFLFFFNQVSGARCLMLGATSYFL